MDKEQTRGLKAAIVAYSLWGLLTLYWKQLSGFDAIELIGWRMASAGVFMAGVVTVTRRWKPVLAALSNRALAGRIAVASLLLALNWTIYVWAVINDRVIETALGYFLSPLATMALGVLVLKEHLTPLKWVSIGIALTAVLILTVSYGRMPWVSLLLAASWSWYGLTKRRIPLDPVESLSSELLILLVPAFTLVSLGWFKTDGIASQAVGTDWGFLIGTGAITAIPLLLFAFAAKRVPFTLLGPINYLVPIINFLLGWIVFGESLPTSRVIGFAFLWVALSVVTIDTFKQRDRGNHLDPASTRR